ncbi:MAG TPA: hypothetical protein VLJ39_13435 [Tepidisphaeraceae bacterium]|nr:hypothetical protein [Tepidisphaeraceae bacterium]
MSRSFQTSLFIFAMVMSAATAARADDQADIKASAKSFAEAIKAGDAPTARKYVVSSDEANNFVDAMAGVTKAKQNLTDAAVAKFGEDGKKIAGASPVGGRSPDVAQNIDNSKVDVNGDTATVTGEKGKAVQFKKEGGQWKIDLASVADFQQTSKLLPMFGHVSTAMNETAREIKDGKYATVQEAQQGLRQKIVAGFGGQPGAGRPGKPGAPSSEK